MNQILDKTIKYCNKKLMSRYKDENYNISIFYTLLV